MIDFLPRCIKCRHGLAMSILSISPSVKRVICVKTKESCVQIFIPYEFSEKMVGGGTSNFG